MVSAERPVSRRVPGHQIPRLPRALLIRRLPAAGRKEAAVLDAPEDGVKVAKELAEEIREETGVQLDMDAWQKVPENGEAKEEATVWYFGYGSNMNKSVFQGRRMIKPAESVAATLPGYRLAFNMPGMPYREPAFAGLQPLPPGTSSSGGSGTAEATQLGSLGSPSPPAASLSGAASSASGGGSSGSGGAAAGDGPAAAAPAVEVHGVAHRITPREWHYVLQTEGALGDRDYGYKAEPVVLQTYDGRTLDAFTLLCQPKSVAFLKGRDALPSQRYLTLLREGAKEHALSPAYQDFLNRLEPYQASTPQRRVGAVLMGGVFLLLVAPVFVVQRLYAKATGMAPGSSQQGDAGGLRARLMSRYLHNVFYMAWGLHDALQPVLGCGCTNPGAAKQE